MTATIHKITHESEIQRQHIRLEIHANAIIDKETYAVKNLSAGGFSIQTDKELNLDSSQIKIIFPFDKYAFVLDAKVRPLYFDQSKKIMAFQFSELSNSQISLLNHIIKSHMSGTLVTEGDLLNVVSRDNFGKIRPLASEKSDIKSSLKRILPTLLILFLGVGGMIFLLTNFSASASILKSYQGVVTGNEITVRAFAGGRLTSLIAGDAEKVTKGQPLATLMNVGGTAGDVLFADKEIVIESPCDCKILARHVEEGEFKTLGERLFTLMPLNSPLWVSMALAPEQAQKISLLNNVNLKIAGEGRFTEGYVVSMDSVGQDRSAVNVKIKPRTPLPMETIGRPVYAEFPLY